MAITLVQSNTTTSSSTVNSANATLSTAPTQGNLLIIWVGEGSNLGTITGPSGWSQVYNLLSGGQPIGSAMYYVEVDATIATQTSWTVSISAKHTLALGIAEFHAPNGWQTTVLDQSATHDGSTATSTTLNSGTTAATSQADELVVANLAFHSGVQTVSGLTTGYSQIFNVASGSGVDICGAWLETSATGAQNCQGTITTASYQISGIATFLPVAGGGPTNVTVTDTAQGFDTPADLGFGAEAVTATASFTLTDTATGADTPIAGTSIPVTDSATGTDSVGSPTVSAPQTDTATGAETLSATVTAPIGESGVGTDTPGGIGSPTPVPLSDSAYGDEEITLTTGGTGGSGGYSGSAATGAANTTLGYAPQRHLEYLCDGSLLLLYQSSTSTVSLKQITSPGSATPAYTAVSQTFSITGSTNTVGDLFILNNGTTTSDVWVTYADNSGTGGLFVAHGTYTASGGTWSWDNTGTSIALGTFNSGFVLGSSVWTGSTLITAFRAQAAAYSTGITYTTTKNGSTGWVAVASLDTGTAGTSHDYQKLLHDATNGCTLIVYCVDADTVKARVIADSTTPSVANWSTAVSLSGTVNVGAANISAVLDPANSRLHAVWTNSSSGSSPQYCTATYTTTSISAGTAFTAGTGTTTATGCAIGLDSASPPTAYIFWSTNAIGSTADVEYITLASPYASGNLGAATNLTNNTATDNALPHVPTQTTAAGYIPLVYEHAVSPWGVIYDTTIAAAGGGTTLTTVILHTDNATGVDALTATATVPLTDAGAGSENISGLITQISDSATGSDVVAIPSEAESLADSGAGSETFGATVTAPLTDSGTGIDRISLGGVGTGIGPLARSTQTQTWINSGTDTEQDFTFVDSTNYGWRLGANTGYGGAVWSAWYEINNGTAAGAGTLGSNASQNSMTTSNSDGSTNPDGWTHSLESAASVTFDSGFDGSESYSFAGVGSFIEQAPIGTNFRAYYKALVKDGAALQTGLKIVVWSCAYPGDPGMIVDRIDWINPTASAVTLSYMNLTSIGGLISSTATPAGAWNHTNAYYASVGGTPTLVPSSGTGEPDYVFVTPSSGNVYGQTLGVVAVKSANLTSLWGGTPNLEYQQNTNRLKIDYNTNSATIPANTTWSFYVLKSLKRNLTSAVADAIAADFLHPGTPTASVGSFTAWRIDERAFEFAASANAVTCTLDLSPLHVSVRYKPIYKITNWTANTPVVAWNGAQLEAGVDYQYTVDSTNHVLYVQLYWDIVSSGAGAGQLNNAALSITPLAVIDSGTGNDVLSALTASAPLVETATGSETVTLVTTAPLADTATGHDSSIAITVQAPIVDTATGAVTQAASVTLAVIDSAAGSDSVTLGSPPVNLTDTATGSDTPVITTTLPLTDVATGAESLTITASFVLAETGTGADALSLFKPVSISDTASGADVPASTASFNLPDSATGVDTPTATLFISVTDTATGSEVQTLTFLIPVVDAASGSDAVAFSGPMVFTLTDQATGNESVFAGNAAPHVNENASGVDSIVVNAGMQLSDGATALETPTITTSVVFADFGASSDMPVMTTETRNFGDASPTGADVVFVQAAAPLNDAALAAESLTVVVRASIQDAAGGSDAVPFAAPVNVSVIDNATGQEVQTFSFVIGFSDIAVGSDTVTVVDLQNQFEHISDTGAGSELVVRAVQYYLASTPLYAYAGTTTLESGMRENMTYSVYGPGSSYTLF